MSKLRSVSTAFWSDPFIEDLTPNEKLLYLYFITNEKTNMLGIYEVSIKKISFETGITKETVSKALEVFERLNKVKYIDNYIILTNFLKHQHFNTNMMKSAIDCYIDLPKTLKDSTLILDKNNPLESFQTLSNALLMVRKVEVEYELEIEVKDEKEKEIFLAKNFEKNEHHLQKYILENLKIVSKMKEQMTFEHCEKIIEKYGLELVNKKLLAMENYKELLKKNNSVFLTLNNWCDREVVTTKQNKKQTSFGAIAEIANEDWSDFKLTRENRDLWNK
jgi:hypothetical protein